MLAMMNVPPTVIIGVGARFELAAQLKRLGARRVLLVTDDFMVESGLVGNLVNHLMGADIETFVFDGVQPDPTVENVDDGLSAFKKSRAEVIVALGGGSPMDAAKAISIMTANPEPLSQYMGYHKIANAGASVIAVPTTAGTGSEVTKVTVITDAESDIKMMMLDTHLLPAVALVDPELSKTMPPSLTANVGVDTLTHAIESYVSRKANAMTDPIALSCIRLVSQHLMNAWQEPDNMEARSAMALAATQGGIAFSNSSVCLVHGMSRPLGAIFHIPHGLSNAVLLPAVTRFSVPGATARYATISRTMGYATESDGDETAVKGLIDGLQDLNVALQIPRLRDCKGIDAEVFGRSLNKMAEDSLASGSPQNNPIIPDIPQIVRIYREAW